MGDLPHPLDQQKISELLEMLCREGVDVLAPGGITRLRQTLEEQRVAQRELTQTRQQLAEMQAATRVADLDLRELQQKHDALFFRNTDAIFSIDPDGRFISANPACAELSGYSLEEFLSISFQDLVAPDQLQHTMWNFQRCLQDIFERLETAIIRKDGQRVEMLVHGGPIWRDDRLVALHCAAKDVTEWKQAEANLLKSEERCKMAMDATRDGIWDWDIRTNQLFWSRQLFRILGYIPGEIQASIETFNRVLHPDDVQGTWDKVNRHLSGQSPLYETEFRLRRKDGSYCWVLSRGRAVRDDQGQAVRMVGSHADITERKRNAEERDHLLAREQEARKQLEEAHRAKDRFLAVLSHELRTPLTPVLTCVQMMEREPDISPTLNELVQMVRRNVELEARLIDDLLDLTRISRGKLELFFAPTDIHAKIRQVIDICQSDIRSEKLTLKVELDARRSHVRADAARLQQVLWNLLKNAVKFTPQGGTIGIRTSDVENRIMVEVWDTGIGIDGELLPLIFDAFEQGGKQVTRKHGGLGLGLTVSRWLVEAHGGTIEARSEGHGKGSIFKISLPLSATPEPKKTSLPRRSPSGAGKGRRLLLVEDNVDTIRAMTRLLTLDGYSVQTADTVSSALRAADGENFDLLICDIGLPDGSGLDLMRQIMSRKPIKAIALSGYGMEEDVNRSKEAGFIEHLTKPVNLQRLEETISRIIDSQTSANLA